MFRPFYFDYYYLVLVLPMILLSLIVHIKLKSSYSKHSKIQGGYGITGAQAAQMVLNSKGIYDVRIEPVRGELTDHFDPRTKVIRLSEGVYNSSSIAAVGIAAHEAGHAVQHAEGYVPNKIRSALVPVVNIGSQFSFILIILGIAFQPNFTWLTLVGIILFAATTLFSLITLPVEFNASSRAIKIIENQGILPKEQMSGAKSVLSAAAMTYVASLLVSVAQLLRLVLIVFGSGNRRKN